MPSTVCDCGHWNYDHRNTTDECDVGYCECKMFELDPDEDSVENPWEGDGFIRRILHHQLGIGEDYLSNPDWLDKEFSWLNDEKIKALKKAFLLENHNKKPRK